MWLYLYQKFGVGPHVVRDWNLNLKLRKKQKKSTIVQNGIVTLFISVSMATVNMQTDVRT